MSDSSPIHVVLVEPEIHWNTGNAGRTCLAAGAQLHLVQPLGFSLDVSEVRRAGLDYWPHVNPRVWGSWKAIEPKLEKLGTVALFSPTAERTLWEVDLSPPCALVFGSETSGLAPEILATRHDQVVRIPQQSGTVRSLNLSTCVGIAVFEALRQGTERLSRADR
jgi:tRNA (cytidine/uridine-2'-O-)-methyltransferase